ncbi:MAG TPA: hypothetical protein DDZ81_10440 [Acetobacteraceae bacterium]|jgi:predicted tellurium resistance membrane protein TerC|nr:hypothetical protein [Acetobacteraceae bacterium]
MTSLADPNIWASFATLTALEIVLGVDNLVFIAMLAGRVAPAQRGSARTLGLAFALGSRLALLWSIAWLVHLTHPAIWISGDPLSWRDLILIGGGAFLLFKGTQEIHHRMDDADEAEATSRKRAGFVTTIVQIGLFDIVFSLDSVITAVGLAEEVWVMAAAIIVAMVVMLVASNPLAAFIERHASVKMLALSFLLLIGTMLIADGLGFHMPRGYVYSAMGFSVMVESLNLLVAKRRRTKERRAQETGGLVG